MGTHGLPKGRHQNIRANAREMAKPGPSGPKRPHRVGLVHIKRGIVTIAKAAKPNQVGAVPVHAVVGLDNDPTGGSGGRSLETPLELIQVEMFEDVGLHPGEAHPVDERGVVQTIGKNRVLG
jgi:hypothetical protein